VACFDGGSLQCANCSNKAAVVCVQGLAGPYMRFVLAVCIINTLQQRHLVSIVQNSSINKVSTTSIASHQQTICGACYCRLLLQEYWWACS